MTALAEQSAAFILPFAFEIMALKKRFELRMGDDMSDALDDLAGKLKTDRAEVLRRALVLYERVKKDDSYKVVLVNKKDDKSVELMGV